MESCIIPKGYRSLLNVRETEVAIKYVKDTFEHTFSKAMGLLRISAPLFVEKESGLNDNLNGVERPVDFDIKENGASCQIVQSLAKWKRVALRDYDFHVGKGLYTEMNAIRRDEDLDNLHSVYVDQWDWEKVIRIEDRNEAYLMKTVQSIVNAICNTDEKLRHKYEALEALTPIKRQVTFITSQELENMYPDLTPKQREHAFAKEHRTIFIMKIGKALESGKPHDGRAPDYDDWDLNGDLLFWDDVLGISIEISSMGIRVSPESLDSQLTAAGCDDRRKLPFHKELLEGKLPYTIGGGIGQSRLCMLLLGCAHIGEVQSAVWDADTRTACRKAGIDIL